MDIEEEKINEINKRFYYLLGILLLLSIILTFYSIRGKTTFINISYDSLLKKVKMEKIAKNILKK
tara:strand:- start:1083 stop:1277 length:195 start_codon:yes stop_codon:yes gene_type:complete